MLLCVEIWRDGGGDVWITGAGAFWAVAYASHRASALLLLPVAVAHVALGVVADKAAAKSLGLRAGLGMAPVIASTCGLRSAFAGMAAFFSELRLPGGDATLGVGETLEDVVADLGGGSRALVTGLVMALAISILKTRGEDYKIVLLGLSVWCPCFALFFSDAEGLLIFPIVASGLATAVVATEGLRLANERSDLAILVVLTLCLAGPALNGQVVLTETSAAATADTYVPPAKPPPPLRPEPVRVAADLHQEMTNGDDDDDEYDDDE